MSSYFAIILSFLSIFMKFPCNEHAGDIIPQVLNSSLDLSRVERLTVLVQAGQGFFVIEIGHNGAYSTVRNRIESMLEPV